MESNAMTTRTYWVIWSVLLGLTLVMLGVESVELPRSITVFILTAAMMIKATLIGGWFMHLRWETLTLMLFVVCSILITSAFMFFLLIPDALAA